MATCETCGQNIVFGGVKEGGYRFCNRACRDNGRWFLAVNQIPEEVVAAEVGKIRQANCPKCGGPGPVDLHTSHTVKRPS